MLFRSIRSEWVKKKNSLANWLVLVGGAFVPTLFFIKKCHYGNDAAASYQEVDYWQMHWMSVNDPMMVLFMPMGIVMATALMTHLETKNNAWKLVHTTPQSLHLAFWGKYLVVLLMLVQLFLLFNICTWVVGWLPVLFFDKIHWPAPPLPWKWLLHTNALLFISSLPVVAVQYLVSVTFRNFLIPVGAGMAVLIGSLISISWKYIYLSPYAHPSIQFLLLKEHLKPERLPVPIQWMSLLVFAVASLLSWGLYVHRKDRS
jgi:hypothetical protein